MHETLEVEAARIATPTATDTGWRWEAKCGNCDWRRVFAGQSAYRRAVTASRAHERITNNRRRTT